MVKQVYAQISMSDDINKSLQQAGKIDLRFDSRNAFITNQNVKILGVKLGLIHNKKFYYGLGYNELKSIIKKPICFTLDDGRVKNYTGSVKFNYWSPYMGYTFYQRKRWELSMPIQLGLGNSWLAYTDEDGVSREYAKDAIVLYEAQTTAQYTFLKYFAIGGGLGYRLMLKGNLGINERFDSPIYVMKLKFLLGKFRMSNQFPLKNRQKLNR